LHGHPGLAEGGENIGFGKANKRDSRPPGGSRYGHRYESLPYCGRIRKLKWFSVNSGSSRPHSSGAAAERGYVCPVAQSAGRNIDDSGGLGLFVQSHYVVRIAKQATHLIMATRTLWRDPPAGHVVTVTLVVLVRSCNSTDDRLAGDPVEPATARRPAWPIRWLRTLRHEAGRPSDAYAPASAMAAPRGGMPAAQALGRSFCERLPTALSLVDSRREPRAQGSVEPLQAGLTFRMRSMT
jgi:hypothetical protein